MELCYPKTKEDLLSYLGEAIHTAFRKATDCPQAHPIWKLIQEMPEDSWGAVLEFVALDESYGYGLNMVIKQRQELNEPGRQLCQTHPDVDYRHEWGCPRCLAELRDNPTEALFAQIMAKYEGPINPIRDGLIKNLLAIREALK